MRHREAHTAAAIQSSLIPLTFWIASLRIVPKFAARTPLLQGGLWVSPSGFQPIRPRHRPEWGEQGCCRFRQNSPGAAMCQNLARISQYLAMSIGDALFSDSQSRLFRWLFGMMQRARHRPGGGPPTRARTCRSGVLAAIFGTAQRPRHRAEDDRARLLPLQRLSA